MSAVFNDAGKSTLADGATLTTANTGVSGNTNLAFGTSTCVKRINPALPRAPSDTAWYECPATATGVNSYLTIQPGTLVAATGGAVGAWFMLSGYPTAGTQFFRFGNSGANFVAMATTGKLYLAVNNATVKTFASAVPLNTPFWVSHASDSKASAGTARAGWWDIKGNLIDSALTTTGVTSGVTSSISYVGKISGSGALGAMQIASLRANNDSNALIPPVIPKGVRGWGIAA
jgi:hypothetical protein